MTSLVELIPASEELGNSLLCGPLLGEVCVRSAEQNVNKKRHRVSGLESESSEFWYLPVSKDGE